MNKSEFTRTCALCGEDLSPLDRKIETICDICHNKATESFSCKSGHVICDDCLDIDAITFIKSSCLKYQGIDPIALAVEIMNSPAIKMHGPEHHFIAPAVLMTCVLNLQKKSIEIKDKLDLIANRAFVETSGSCAFRENLCGAACGMGVFLSVFLDRTLSEDDAWSESNEITAACLKEIESNHGPRCCKRDTYLSLQASIKFLKERFALELPISGARCSFSLRNKSCGHEVCGFYNLSNSIA